MKRTIISALAISVLAILPVQAREVTIRDSSKYTVGVPVICDTEAGKIPDITPTPTVVPTKEPTPTPAIDPTPIPTKDPTPIPTRIPTATPTPRPTVPPKDDDDYDPEYWWKKLIEAIKEIQDRTKVVEIERRVETPAATQTYYVTKPAEVASTTPTSQVKVTPTPAASAAGSAKTTGTTAKVTPTPTPTKTPQQPVPTPVIKEGEKTEAKYDLEKARRAQDEARKRFIPNEYYGNVTRPIPTPAPKEKVEKEVEEESEEVKEDFLIEPPAPDDEEAKSIEIKEEKKPFYLRLWFWALVLLLLALIALLIVCLVKTKEMRAYRKANKKHKNDRPVISGVVTDVENRFVEIIKPNRATSYTLLQSEANKARKAKESAQQLRDRVVASGYSTRLPYETYMVVTISEDREKTTINDLEPCDDAIYETLSANMGKKVKVTFFADKAFFEASVEFELKEEAPDNGEEEG